MHAKISKTPFDHKFFLPPDVSVLRWRKQTNTHTQTDIAPLGLNRVRYSEKPV